MSQHENIRVMLVLDVIGRPPEHLVKTLEKLIEDMGKEKGVILKSKSIKEPVSMKDNKEFYTTFAEVEVEVESILYLAVLMFAYMPAHVEVISPETITISNNGWSEVLSEIIRRLHSYDEVAGVMSMEREQLIKRIVELERKIAPMRVQENMPSEKNRKEEKVVEKISKKKKK